MDFDDRASVKLWILENQMARRNLTAVQRGRLALKYKDMIAARAKEKQLSTLKQNTEADMSVCQISDKRTIDTKKELAKMAGISHDTIYKLETVDTKAPEQVKQAMEADVISINKAYEATKATEEDPKLKEVLESSHLDKIPEVLAKALMQANNEAKRQQKIMSMWRMLYTLDYDDSDYEIWLSDISEDGIDNQMDIVDGAVKRVLKVQAQLKEVVRQRRKMRLVK
jgi:hypothetical protein